jgi:hypothetical protein
MNLFKQKTSWTNVELGIFKIAVFSAGILFGVYAQPHLTGNLDWLWLLMTTTSLIAAYLWAIKMKITKKIKQV